MLKSGYSILRRKRTEPFTARRTLRGIEAMAMIRKRQVKGINQGSSVSQMKFIAKLFALSECLRQRDWHSSFVALKSLRQNQNRWVKRLTWKSRLMLTGCGTRASIGWRIKAMTRD